MAKGIYFGVGGVARKVKKVYFGVGGVARKVKKIYFGVNGVARLCYTSSVPAGQVMFTSSQVWTVPDGVTKIDIFCVGAGGSSDVPSLGSYQAGALGAGSGYTATQKNISVTPGQQISVSVGAPATGTANQSGSSSFGTLCIAQGGYSSRGIAGGVGRHGLRGGSGGGNGANPSESYISPATNGGADGSDGIDSTTGKGQGTTTRAFGEATNTLYAGGGGGGNFAFWHLQLGLIVGITGIGGAGGGGTGATAKGTIGQSTVASSGTPNTGGGGGGGAAYREHPNSSNLFKMDGGLGGSGVVMVRWAEQE